MPTIVALFENVATCLCKRRACSYNRDVDSCNESKTVIFSVYIIMLLPAEVTMDVDETVLDGTRARGHLWHWLFDSCYKCAGK